MSSLIETIEAVDVRVSDDALIVTLKDGRAVSAPLKWFPRLQAATPVQRSKWEILGPGTTLHWEEIDEDISVRWLLTGTD
ncbi:DUF2442 domain-containing protein [Microbacterium protaetiae]|uniref:DUF2442 domain-containing protein n=1 Tax=Microbacterium protaetiae TaxID=2509458 RepID=A0A4V0YD13_9MICO|nr:DUF2442 domain-containing protein [Microbacterium protaetiae]QAY59111.1 DUF2442 domain-containing protein [Microbacterium protaetiae]